MKKIDLYSFKQWKWNLKQGKNMSDSLKEKVNAIGLVSKSMEMS